MNRMKLFLAAKGPEIVTTIVLSIAVLAGLYGVSWLVVTLVDTGNTALESLGYMVFVLAAMSGCYLVRDRK